jgi:hypothetical protein
MSWRTSWHSSNSRAAWSNGATKGMRQWRRRWSNYISVTRSSQSIGVNYWRPNARQCWNRTCFSRRNETAPSKEGPWLERGNKQRDYNSKEDASSPTIATEAVLLSCIINAEKGREVTVIDIPNAFIQTRVEDEGNMAINKICGVLVDILVKIAPDVYKSYVTTDKKGTKQLLVQCPNALYGTMVASLLDYRKFTKSLTSVRFKINPYDPHHRSAFFILTKFYLKSIEFSVFFCFRILIFTDFIQSPIIFFWQHDLANPRPATDFPSPAP